MMERLAAYANEHGAMALLLTRGREDVTARDWDTLRHSWRHAHGLTNVWRLAPLRGAERIKRAAPGSGAGLRMATT